MIINLFISFFNEIFIRIFVTCNRNFHNMFFGIITINICEYNIIYNMYSLKKIICYSVYL